MCVLGIKIYVRKYLSYKCVYTQKLPTLKEVREDVEVPNSDRIFCSSLHSQRLWIKYLSLKDPCIFRNRYGYLLDTPSSYLWSNVWNLHYRNLSRGLPCDIYEELNELKHRDYEEITATFVLADSFGRTGCISSPPLCSERRVCCFQGFGICTFCSKSGWSYTLGGKSSRMTAWSTTVYQVV